MSRLAIIPARSGSKGLKDKNIKILCGKPLLAYTIEAAIASKAFDEVYVSTDSKKYAQIACEYFASVPFFREKNNATDEASSWDAVREALIRYEKMGRKFDECVLLQPTSPLRTGEDISRAIKLFEERKADSVVSVCEVEHPVQWCFRRTKDQSMREFSNSPYRNMRRQELECYYRENGAIYIVKTDNIRDVQYDIYQNNCYMYVMDKRASVDIDDEIDFMLAESIMQKDKSEEKRCI